ncbi:hypothetical protein [Pelagicoccus sp. SDUM812003]|uniref:glycoside hydrolase family 117 protein n=1 Tax=Pelagicoccus sp. SDUM812003 TaxID=3041267 RepID=UPI00280CCA4F|nr:hypothetical protein [Pelagicoccus sp. SDUM812003]MDQ8201429.1 hypothetical protein [Pelagicoccus sp. SDUM812003]
MNQERGYNELAQLSAFPWDIPQTRPERPLSAAFDRLYANYLTPRPEDNPLFTSFKYTRLEGFDYRDGDGSITRRDPSKIIYENGKYYVWYTKRDTICPPRGAVQCTDEIPSTDWDLAEIWYATSEDGFTWKEQGVAVTRSAKPQAGWRSVATPDILKWKGKYYLYYQAFLEASGTKGDHCPVAVSYSDSPDGPWSAVEGITVENGEPGTWDQFSIHGPSPIVYRGKIYLYYKAAFGDRPDYLVGLGLATADDPLGPFEKHPLNPVMNSGHETTFFPFGEGVAALAIRNGNEANTIQYSNDGVNFEVAAVSTLFPTAAKAYDPDAFTDSGDGRGIEWGLCHFTNAGSPGNKYGFLARFDCSLRRDRRDPLMKNTQVNIHPDVYFKLGLTVEQRLKRGLLEKNY